MDPRPPLLPDPTADLHWSDFRGSIQDIFESNALKHPEKLCVIETSSTSSPRREFTYRQINQASNILAHHLVQSGVKRSEVVTVYAHRGVDLPVAVMGILKAVILHEHVDGIPLKHYRVPPFQSLIPPTHQTDKSSTLM